MAQQTTMFQIINPDGGTQTMTQDELQRYYPDVYASQVLASQASPTYHLQYVINHEDPNQQVFHNAGAHQQVMLQPAEQHTIVNSPVKQPGMINDQQNAQQHSQTIYHQTVTSPNHGQTQYVTHHTPGNVQQIPTSPQQQQFMQQSPVQQPVDQQYIIQQAEPAPVQQHEIQTDFRQQQHVPQQQQQIFYATPVSEESRIITNMEPQQQVQQQQSTEDPQQNMDPHMQQYKRFLDAQKAKMDNLASYEAQQVRERGMQQQQYQTNIQPNMQEQQQNRNIQHYNAIQQNMILQQQSAVQEQQPMQQQPIQQQPIQQQPIQQQPIQQQPIQQQQQPIQQQQQHLPQQLMDNQIVQLNDGRQMTVAEWKRIQQQQQLLQQQQVQQVQPQQQIPPQQQQVQPQQQIQTQPQMQTPPRKPTPQLNQQNNNIVSTSPAITNALLQQNRQGDQQPPQQQQQHLNPRFGPGGMGVKRTPRPRGGARGAANCNILRPQIPQQMNAMNQRMPLNHQQQMGGNQQQINNAGTMMNNNRPMHIMNTNNNRLHVPQPQQQMVGGNNNNIVGVGVGQRMQMQQQQQRPNLPNQMNRLNQPQQNAMLNQQNMQMNNTGTGGIIQQPNNLGNNLNTSNMGTTVYGTPVRAPGVRGARGANRGGRGSRGGRGGVHNQTQAPVLNNGVMSGVPPVFSSTEPPALVCTGVMPGGRGATRGNNQGFRGGPRGGVNRGGRGGRGGVTVPFTPPPVMNRDHLSPPRQPMTPQTEPSSPGVDEVRTAKMLVMLENGEQRLITFSLPKESCTVRELLEQVLMQVNVEFIPGVSNIRCVSHPGADIEYIVTVNGPGTAPKTTTGTGTTGNSTGAFNPAGNCMGNTPGSYAMSPGVMPQQFNAAQAEQKLLNNQEILPQQQLPSQQPNNQPTLLSINSQQRPPQAQPLQQQQPPPLSSDAAKSTAPTTVPPTGVSPSTPGANNQQMSFQQSFCNKFQPVDPNSFQYQLQQQIINEKCPEKVQPVVAEKEPIPPAKEEEQPKYVEGMLALCRYCGYISQDFNRCERCKRKLDNPKAIPKEINNKKNPNSENSSDTFDNKNSPDSKKIFQKLDMVSKSGAITVRKCRRGKQKVPEPEPEVLTLSSDDEEEAEDTKDKPYEEITIEVIREKLGLHHKEPFIEEGECEDQIFDDYVTPPTSPEPLQPKPEPENTEMAVAKADSTTVVDTVIVFSCRTVRIGSYKCTPTDEIAVSKELLRLPVPRKDNTPVTLKLKYSQIVKMLVHFGKSLPIIFLYVLPGAARQIREVMKMKDDESEKDYYFNPTSDKAGLYRRIVLIPSEMSPEDGKLLKSLFVGKLDEINQADANEILIRACGDSAKLPHKEKLDDKIALHKLAKSSTGSSSLTNIAVKQLLKYPRHGKGGIPIYGEDYACLATDQFLNDVIIDFYLKYLLETCLTSDKRDKFHIFSTFFYKRLTSKPQVKNRRSVPDFENDSSLSAAQRRHLRVARWTRGIDIFDKDFVIIPINESSHWFLAIICFPNLEGARRLSDDKPVDIKNETKVSKTIKREAKSSTDVMNIPQEDIDGSDRDEAEGSDSDLEHNDSEEDSPPDDASITPPKDENKTRENGEVSPNAIKQPCILIFDSLSAGTSRSRVVATLRDYLTWEHREKFKSTKTFNKLNMRGHTPKVPQQTNFTDCGLYVLQYVEAFLMNPIKDYNIPIKHLKEWFSEFTVTKKREDIAILIKELMITYGHDVNLIPDNITFPTHEGILVEPSDPDHDIDDMPRNPFRDHDDDEELDDEEMMDAEDEEDDELEDGEYTDKHHDLMDDDDEKEMMDEEIPPRRIGGNNSSSRAPIKHHFKSSHSGNKSYLSRKKQLNNSSGRYKKLIERGETMSSDDSVSLLNQSSNLKSISVNYASDSSSKSNRDTMSYLKAKRIVRHKPNDSMESTKRQKMDFSP